LYSEFADGCPIRELKKHIRRSAPPSPQIQLIPIVYEAPAPVGGARGPAPLNKIWPPPARGLGRHNKRFTIKEIIKIVATRCQILRLKCTKSFVGWGSAQTPLGELTVLPQTS